MAEAVVQVEPETQQRGTRPAPSLALSIVIGFYLIVWLFTRAHFMADTNVYTQAILRRQRGGTETDFRSLTSNPFWDFGHILWRPMGWLLSELSRPATQLIAHQNQKAEVLLTLFGINFLASIGCVVCFFLLAKRMTGHPWTAGMATIGFFSADAFLDYSHSGNAYVVGLACLVAGMYFWWREPRSEWTLTRVLAAAVFFALSVLFWLPYAFVLPAAMLAPLLLYDRGNWRLRRTLQLVLVCSALGLTVYGTTIIAVGIHNLTDLREWILAAGHGHIQPGGIRAVARLAFAVPRSFVYMDRDGMWLKRYLVHDPYAQVTTRTLWGLSIWKLLFSYACATVVCIDLFRTPRGRILVLLLMATVLPIFFFAVFIFEAGSIERYLPLYPFIFVALGYVLANREAKRWSKALLIAALAAMFVVNVNAMFWSTAESRKAEAVSRIHDIIPLLNPNSLVLAVNEQDSLAEFRQNYPLDPTNLSGNLRTYDVLEINTERLATWRRDLAERVSWTWQRGGAVWLPARFLSPTPNPEWNWVEGDDKRVHWTDLPAFFARFDTGAKIGGEDGFLQLMNNDHNRLLFEAVRKNGE